MSKREDIVDGSKAFDSSVNYGLVYTCNCGWVDLGHMSSTASTSILGAANLWRQIETDGPEAESYLCALPGPAYPSTYYSPAKTWNCADRNLAVFSDGSRGFTVSYRQQNCKRIPLVGGRICDGVTQHYLVKKNMTEMQRKSVALAIFMEVSHGFETMQSGWLYTWVTDSGYSQEDLVSNLLGFYIAVGQLTRRKIFELCKPVSKEAALQIWDREGAVGSHKNKTARPIFPKDTSYLPEDQKTSIDPCADCKRQFPQELQTITPANKGHHFIDHPTTR